MTPTHRFAFVCPACDESLQVDGPMRDALLETGCVVCSGEVTAASFAGS